MTLIERVLLLPHISQLLLTGAIAAVCTLKFLVHDVPGANKTLGHSFLNENLTPLQGFTIEFFLGFLLLFTVFGTGDENRPESRFAAPLVVGCVVIVGELSHHTSSNCTKIDI